MTKIHLDNDPRDPRRIAPWCWAIADMAKLRADRESINRRPVFGGRGGGGNLRGDARLPWRRPS